jgi:hypothetical protein
MEQPCPSTGSPAGPERPAPAPVLAAVKLMYAGAAVSSAGLITGLALIIADVQAAARGRFFGHSLTAAPMRPLVMTVWIVFGLAGIALCCGSRGRTARAGTGRASCPRCCSAW